MGVRIRLIAEVIFSSSESAPGLEYEQQYDQGRHAHQHPHEVHEAQLREQTRVIHAPILRLLQHLRKLEVPTGGQGWGGIYLAFSNPALRRDS